MNHLFATLDHLFCSLFDFDTDRYGAWMTNPILVGYLKVLFTSKKTGKGPKWVVQSGEQVVHRSAQYGSIAAAGGFNIAEHWFDLRHAVCGIIK